MTSENLIHVRFNYEEALNSKKDILASQISLLKVAKIINSYRESRSHELELKLQLQKKFKELKSITGRLNKVLPKPKIPEIIRKDPEKSETEMPGKKTPTQKKKKVLKYHDNSLEEQLSDIQRKLNELQNR